MIFEGVITFLLFSNVHCVPVEDVPDVKINLSNKEKALQYFNNYGYTNVLVPFSGGGDDNDVIKKFQEDAGLPQSGELDAATMEIISSPRCGVFAENQGHVQKWHKRELTYRVTRYSGKLGKDVIDRIVRRAMDLWEEVADIKFTGSGTKDVDIEIVFGRREHGDKIPFDGPSGTLAHAFYPGSFGRLAGDAHFDDDEDWSDTEFVGKQLLQTCTHELGHSLGLGHSRVRGSVMYFAYPGWDPNLKLHHDDISNIVDLYGRATTPRTPRTRGSCSCSSFTRYDSTLDREVGNCETPYKGKLWCYIEPSADCHDSRRSNYVDYDWSWEACKSTAVPASGCKVISGAATGKSCVFPFKWSATGKTYNECAYEPSKGDEYPWCSTKVDESGIHVTGGGHWGKCDLEHCPGAGSIKQVEDQIVDASPFQVDQQFIDSKS